MSEDLFQKARSMFAQAIVCQRDGKTTEAKMHAEKCLQLLVGFETAEKTAAGEVVAVGNHIICEPSYLHSGTALRRFKQEGIM